MPLTFHPNPGDIVICDYADGFRPPEMVKARPVIVISPRRRGSELATVVPLSSVEPRQAQPWHYRLPDGAYPPARGTIWVKADLITTVALWRLDRIKMREPDGARRYAIFRGPGSVLEGVRAAVMSALNLP